MKNIAMLSIVCVSFMFFSNKSDAQISLLKQKENKTQSIKQGTKTKEKGDTHASLFKQVLRSNQKIKEILEAKTKEPLIWEGENKILSGKIFYGTVLNSIVSTNLATPVIVLADANQGLPHKTKFICQGVTLNERVQSSCHKMVTSLKEVSVQAQLLNTDGSSGLLGRVDDKKAELIAGALASDFSKGVLSVASSRVATPFGEINDGSSKNQIYGGMIESAKTTSDVLLDEYKNQEPVVTVNAGYRVLIYFMEAVYENN